MSLDVIAVLEYIDSSHTRFVLEAQNTLYLVSFQ